MEFPSGAQHGAGRPRDERPRQDLHVDEVAAAEHVEYRLGKHGCHERPHGHPPILVDVSIPRLGDEVGADA